MAHTFGILLLSILGLAGTLRADTTEADASVVLELTGAQLATVTNYPIDRLAVVACTNLACRPIPFQVDEMTSDGRWVLPQGPSPLQDDPPREFDGNDLLLWKASDSGETLTDPRLLLPHRAAVAVEIERSDGQSRWVYVLAMSEKAPRAKTSYVDYRPDDDLMFGHRIALGFHDGIPDRLIPTEGNHEQGDNLLDRFKVRARAAFLWGLIHFSRDEDDLTGELVGWQSGPIRIIRCQQQRVRLGWGIRSPAFSVCTFFHPDFAELTMAFSLNYPPTYFFTDIEVDVLLDFRDLRDWRLTLPGQQDIVIGASPANDKTTVSQSPTWFALQGPGLTLAQILYVSESLEPARRRFLLRDTDAPNPPEAIAGEHPAVGYRLDRWEHVAAGTHGLKAVALALPAGADVAEFIRSRQRVRVTRVQAIP